MPLCSARACVQLCLFGVSGRHVQRSFNPWTGIATISGVDEQHAVQCGAGDLLYLQGNLCQGMAGKSYPAAWQGMMNSALHGIQHTGDNVCPKWHAQRTACLGNACTAYACFARFASPPVPCYVA